MTRLEAQGLIQDRLGQRTGLASRIVAELQQAQREFERKPFLPSFLRTVLDEASSSKTGTVPADFLREVSDESFLSIVDSDTGMVTPLIKESYQWCASQEDLSSDTEQPVYFAIFEDTTQSARAYEVFPTPDKSYTYRKIYYAKDTVLTSDSTENRWLIHAPDLLIAQAGLQVAKALRSPEAVQLFASDLIEARRSLYHSTIEHDIAGRDMVLGG